jgi:hypothetical protein
MKGTRMRKSKPHPRSYLSVSIAVVACWLVLSSSSRAQIPAESASASADTHWSVAPYSSSPEQKNPILTAGSFSLQTTAGEVKEDQLKQLLVGKTLYLRSGYQDNNLEFDESGRLTSHSPQGSFTLSQIQINKVKLTKRKLELQGDRYGLHFLGAAPYEDPTKATDRVKITPKKKTVRISFDREQVEKPKKEKQKHKHKGHDKDQANERQSDESSAKDATVTTPASQATYHPSSLDRSSSSKGNKETTKTTSPAHASQLLLDALDHAFSIGIDDRMIGAMPEFWKLYYQAAAAKAEIKPLEPGIFHQNAVNQKPKLISVIDPPSNDFAQSSGVAGMALYHAVIGADGKVQEVVAGRPIGFGLDENAENTIRNATFEPAMKDGKAVPVSLDLVVSFRIFSKRTSQASIQQADDKPNSPALPGPYTRHVLEQAQQPQPAQQPDTKQPATESAPDISQSETATQQTQSAPQDPPAQAPH